MGKLALVLFLIVLSPVMAQCLPILIAKALAVITLGLFKTAPVAITSTSAVVAPLVASNIKIAGLSVAGGLITGSGITIGLDQLLSDETNEHIDSKSTV